MHDAQRHTVWEIKGDTKRGKRVMTYSEMCESRTNKRRTLTERVFEQQTATTTTILEGTPDTPTLVSYFFSPQISFVIRAIAIVVRVTHNSFHPHTTVVDYYCYTQGDDSMMHAVTACSLVKNACQCATIQACFRRAAGA